MIPRSYVARIGGCILLVVSSFFIGWFFLLPVKKAEVIQVNARAEESIPSFPLVSLPTIFADDHSWTATLSAEHTRTLIATGDILTARSVNAHVVELQNFLWPYEKTVEVLRSGDITFANLETPLVRNCPVTHSGMIFCGDPRHIQGLQYAEIDVISLANNHTANHGTEGIVETITLLDNAGIAVTGTDTIAFREIRGMRFAFLGFNDIDHQNNLISRADDVAIIAKVKEARSQSDIVVVTFHWGNEYTTEITNRQHYYAHLAIDSGADLIIGNHAHWIQPVEVYKGKVIAYAHGNFIFDQMWSQKTEEGVVGKYTFYGNQLVDVEFLPVEIADMGQPYLLTDEKKERVLSDMRQASELHVTAVRSSP